MDLLVVWNHRVMITALENNIDAILGSIPSRYLTILAVFLVKSSHTCQLTCVKHFT